MDGLRCPTYGKDVQVRKFATGCIIEVDARVAYVQILGLLKWIVTPFEGR